MSSVIIKWHHISAHDYANTNCTLLMATTHGGAPIDIAGMRLAGGTLFTLQTLSGFTKYNGYYLNLIIRTHAIRFS